MSALDVAPVASEPTTDRPMLHAYCSRCLGPVAACGFVHDGPLGPERDGDRCVVCVELQWTPCPACDAPP